MKKTGVWTKYSYGQSYRKIVDFMDTYKEFDLKEGDIVIAPYTVYSDCELESEVRDLEMRVTAIYPHIFTAEAVELSPSGVVRTRSYRKLDYCMGFIKRKEENHD